MVFDSKYFTGSDSTSYLSENNLYKSSQGITVGEELGVGASPLSSVQKALMHGFQTVMIGMVAPGGGGFGRQDIQRALDVVSEQQLKATGEMLRLNKMNFITHGPIVDLMGVAGGEGKEQQGISAQIKEENIKIFEKTIENTDKMAQQASLKNIPITIHPVNSLGAQGEYFDSGYRTNEGKIIYGKTGSMIKKDDGKILPIQSTFKWLPIKEYGKDNSLYTFIEGTQDGEYALFEITPEKHLMVANNTALDEFNKRITDADIKMKQIERDTYGFNTIITKEMTDNLENNNPGYHNLKVEKKTINAEIANAKKVGGQMGLNIFSSAQDYVKEVIPEQINRLALASYKTKTQPVLAIENLPVNQFGSPNDVIEIVSESRKKFAQTLHEKEGLDWEDAKKKSNEIIGITMDIGHLNTFKSKINPKTNKYWSDEDLKKEAEKMAQAGVKLVHIADNIGELGKDSHLMLGRGNAKIDEMLDILKQNGFQGQAAIESYEGEGDFDKFWAKNNLRALGSMYQSGSGPSFMDIDMSSQYSLRNSNYGHKVPDLHWSQWGGPFAGIQSTFGATPADKRDSFSGTPTS